MATTTGGTLSSTGLTSLLFTRQSDDNTFFQDIGTMNNLILDDKANIFPNLQTIGTPTVPVGQTTAGLLSGGLEFNGILTIPNRGVLKVYPGDYVMVDTVSGWPILVSRTAALCSGTKWNP